MQFIVVASSSSTYSQVVVDILFIFSKIDLRMSILALCKIKSKQKSPLRMTFAFLWTLNIHPSILKVNIQTLYRLKEEISFLIRIKNESRHNRYNQNYIDFVN